MEDQIEIDFPEWKYGEEVVNSITHAVGIGFALTMLVLFIIDGIKTNTQKLIGNLIFGITMLILYLNSTIYHGLPQNKYKRIWRYFDHISIFFLIAGTYTPLCMTIIWPTSGKIILLIVWVLALFGTIMKILYFEGFMILSVVLYLVMGWLISFSISDINQVAKKGFLLWLVMGGISYSVGVIFYSIDQKVPYFHVVFHFFILFGSVCHSIAMLTYL